MVVEKHREGAKAEVKMLKNLATSLQYDIVAPENPTAQQMMDTMRKVTWTDVEYSSLLVFISCHGGARGGADMQNVDVPGASPKKTDASFKNVLYGSDDKEVDLLALQRMVDAVTAPAFVKSPKIFVVNACRTVEGKPGMTVKVAADKIGYKIDPSYFAEGDNFFTARATLDTKFAYRDPQKGSFYLQALVKVWEAQFRTLRLIDLQMNVRNELRSMLDELDDDETVRVMQVPVDENTLHAPVVNGEFQAEFVNKLAAQYWRIAADKTCSSNEDGLKGAWDVLYLNFKTAGGQKKPISFVSSGYCDSWIGYAPERAFTDDWPKHVTSSPWNCWGGRRTGDNPFYLGCSFAEKTEVLAVELKQVNPTYKRHYAEQIRVENSQDGKKWKTVLKAEINGSQTMSIFDLKSTEVESFASLEEKIRQESEAAKGS